MYDLGLGLEGPGLGFEGPGLGLGLEGPGLVNIPGSYSILEVLLSFIKFFKAFNFHQFFGMVSKYALQYYQ